METRVSDRKFEGILGRHGRVMEGRGLRKHGVRTFNEMLKLLRDLFVGERLVPVPVLAMIGGDRTEQVAALVHVSQTAATMGRCR